MAHVHAIVRTALKYERIVVHCSAGLGRSGVIAAIIEITRQLQAGATKISMFGTVRKLREYRYGAVQNNQQYAFIYEYFRKMNPQGG